MDEPPAWRHEFVLAARERAIGRAAELVAEVRAGRLVRVSRGVYRHAAAVTTDRDRRPDDAYRARVRAAQLRSERPLIFAGLSAAVVWDLPIVGNWPDRVTVSVPPDAGGRSNAHVARTYVGHPPPTTDRAGLLVTSLARTVVDVARTEPMERSVVMMDAALRGLRSSRPAISKRDAWRELLALGKVGGMARARGVIEFADAASGSAGESCSRVGMLRIGLQAPVLQREFVDANGSIGFVDFWWPEIGVVGEFDGRSKYRRAEYTNGRSIEEVVFAEKERENRLRALGLGVVRWDWSVAMDVRALEQRLRQGGVR